MLLLTLLFIVLQVNAQRTYALLAGVSNYNDTEVNLANTTKDVKEMQSVWKQQGAVVATITSKYATPENIMKKLDAIVKLAYSKDKIDAPALQGNREETLHGTNPKHLLFCRCL